MTHRGCLGVAVICTKGKENDNMPFLSVIVFSVANLSACYSRVNGVFNLGLSVVWSQGAAVLLQNTILLETEDLNSIIHTIYIHGCSALQIQASTRTQSSCMLNTLSDF